MSKEQLIAPNIGKCADMDESKLPDLILAEVKQKQELFCLDVKNFPESKEIFTVRFDRKRNSVPINTRQQFITQSDKKNATWAEI